MLYCFNFTVGKLKSSRKVHKDRARALESDYNIRLRTSSGFRSEHQGAAQITPFNGLTPRILGANEE